MTIDTIPREDGLDVLVVWRLRRTLRGSRDRAHHRRRIRSLLATTRARQDELAPHRQEGREMDHGTAHELESSAPRPMILLETPAVRRQDAETGPSVLA